MNAPPASPTTRDAASLAMTLADVLSLGLPEPDYITMHPRFARDTGTSAVDFQFNRTSGQDPLPALRAWADRFGATIRVNREPGSTWHKFDFTHAGVRFHAYAEIAAAAPEPVLCAATTRDDDDELWTCGREDGHPGSHHAEFDGGGVAWSDPAPVTGRDVLLSAMADTAEDAS